MNALNDRDRRVVLVDSEESIEKSTEGPGATYNSGTTIQPS